MDPQTCVTHDDWSKNQRRMERELEANSQALVELRQQVAGDSYEVNRVKRIGLLET